MLKGLTDLPSLSYLVDGNAYFYTAVDISRRLEYLYSTRTVIVGIGYPPSNYVYDFRRGPDLTPKAPEYDMPLDRHGKPRTDISFGEAEEFLAWIKSQVMPRVEGTVFPEANLATGRRALYGHSYGGIFTLNTMYSEPDLFDTYIAASPTVWWNKDFLIRQPEVAFRNRKSPLEHPVSLVLTWGECKGDLTRHHGEAEAVFRKRQDCAEEDQIQEYMDALVSRLETCPSLRNLQTRKFKNEDHGSAAVTGLQHGLTTFVLENL